MKTAKKVRKSTTRLVVLGEPADRLLKLSHRWRVSPDEALRRVIDQALIALEHFTRKKPENKKGEEVQ